MSLRRQLAIWAALAAILVVSTCARGQTAITLRKSANIAGDAAVTVGDIARVKGTDSDRISSVIVLETQQIRAGATTRVDVNDVRRALSALEAFNWGEVTIRGSSCDVVSPPPPAVGQDTEERTRSKRASHDVPMVVASSIGAGTVRARVAATLAAYLDVEPQHLKIGFEAKNSGLLGRVPGDLTVEIRPISVSGRMPVRVTLFDAKGVRDETSELIRVQVRVLLETAKAVQIIRRGSVIEAEDIEVAQSWMEPGIPWARGNITVGSNAARTIEPGDYVRADQVREPLAVKRGELVSVRCVSGSFILRSKARATVDAKRGEIIELESLAIDHKDRRRFKAKITGPGQAVVVDEIEHETGAK